MTRTCGSISVRSVLVGGGLVEEEEVEKEEERGASGSAPVWRGLTGRWVVLVIVVAIEAKGRKWTRRRAP